MLQRPASAPVWSPARRLAARLGVLTGPQAGLLRYVLIAAIGCALLCAYLWQVNDLSNIHDATLTLQYQANQLEEKNVALAEQLAQWNSPAYVEQRSTEEGYVVAPQRKIEAPSVAVGPTQPTMVR